MANLVTITWQNDTIPALNATNLNAMQNNIETFVNASISEMETVANGVPIGGVIPYFGTTEPTNWLFPNGQSVSKTTYPELYALLGNDAQGNTIYGQDLNAGTFVLPDLREAIPVMKGSTLSTLGNIVGDNEKQILQYNLPNYNLTVSDPGHTHTVPNTTTDAYRTTQYNQDGNGVLRTGSQTRISGVRTTGISVNSGGNDIPFNVMQKSMICNYLIRAK